MCLVTAGATHQVKTYKDFVSVVIEQGRERELCDSAGLDG
jgi:hypothetical protein